MLQNTVERAILGALFVTVAAFVVGCGQSGGGSGGAGGAADTGSTNASGGSTGSASSGSWPNACVDAVANEKEDDRCESCMFCARKPGAPCAEEWSQCDLGVSSETPCKAFKACKQECSNQNMQPYAECAAACAAEHPDGVAAQNVFFVCVCTDACDQFCDIETDDACD